MPAIRTSRYYTKLPDTELSKFVGGNIKGFTNNPDLDDPPVTPAQLTTLKKTFDDAIVAASGGGTLATATKDAARAACVAALDKNASYVDINCDEDLTILLSSGYQSVSTNRAQVVLNPPQIVAADYAQAGEIKLRVTGGEFGPVVSFKNSKNILFKGLTAGTTYVMQLCGLGGLTGQSDWSEPVSKMAL
jgi:hypothetical protein